MPGTERVPDGEVYRDSSKPLRQISHTPMTAEQVNEASALLLAEVGKKAPYDLLTSNCAHWSMKTYDFIKKEVKK